MPSCWRSSRPTTTTTRQVESEHPPRGSVDARAIRLGTPGGIGATQQAFADLIGVAVATLRNWEQGRRDPTGPARVLLAMMARDPWLVFDVANEQCRRVPSDLTVPGAAGPRRVAAVRGTGSWR
jgi:DNA-binding transcriptional regulator YiaG